MSGNPMSVKLTKKIFMAAPAGGLLVSNCMHSPTKSIFEEVVATTLADKEKQWERIVSAGASQRLCRIFASQDEYKAWLSTISVPQST